MCTVLKGFKKSVASLNIFSKRDSMTYSINGFFRYSGICRNRTDFYENYKDCFGTINGIILRKVFSSMCILFIYCLILKRKVTGFSDCWRICKISMREEEGQRT